MSKKNTPKTKIQVTNKPRSSSNKASAPLGRSKPRQRSSFTTGAPVSVGNVFIGNKPDIGSIKGSTDIRVRHREFVGTLQTASGLFNLLASYVINPSNGALFPWLSALASRYESYLFHSLKVEFRTELPTSAAGYMMLVPDFNTTDPPPTSKSQAMQYQSMISGPLWQNYEIQFKREDLQKRKSYYCNNTVPIGTVDLTTFNVGVLYAACGDVNATSVNLAGGNIFVTYDVSLMTPEYFADPPQAAFDSASNLLTHPGIPGNTQFNPSVSNNVVDLASIGKGVANYMNFSTGTFGGGVNGLATLTRPFQGLLNYDAAGTSTAQFGSTLTSSNTLSSAVGLNNPLSTFADLFNQVSYSAGTGNWSLSDSAYVNLNPGDTIDTSKLNFVLNNNPTFTPIFNPASQGVLYLAPLLLSKFSSDPFPSPFRPSVRPKSVQTDIPYLRPLLKETEDGEIKFGEFNCAHRSTLPNDVRNNCCSKVCNVCSN